MKFLLRMLKYLLILIAVIAVLGGAFWMVYIRKLPLWSGASLVIGAIGLLIAWRFIRYLMVRRNEKAFVKQVVEQEQPLVDITGNRAAEQIQSLERQWAEAINLLRESHLAQKGDPLYALPWYMLIGAAGSGKSSALRSARLSSPFPESLQPEGTGTRFCDWWFTEHAIFLDTAGKYSDPHIDSADHDEWKRLLSLLMAARKKEPLNGVIVTVEATHLLEGSQDMLEEEGRVTRLRLDELMRVIGSRFPVYVLVTKCDQIYGLAQAVEQLPDSFLRQPMGLINDDFEKPSSDFVQLAITSISEQLKDLRLLQLDRVSGNKNGLMLLPEEFSRLQPGLARFMGGLFRSNPYQESLMMRGLYFCSAIQSGSPVSRFIEELSGSGGLHQATSKSAVPSVAAIESDAAMPLHTPADRILFMDVLPGTRKGMFLFDFFDWVLPTDRWMFKPHREMLRRMRVTWSLGVIAWLAVMGSILGLMSTSYLLNRRTINLFNSEFKEPLALKYDLQNDIIILDRLRQTIVRMEDSNRKWRYINLGLDQSQDTVDALKKRYSALTREFLEKEINSRIVERVLKFDSNTPGMERGAYILTIIDRLQYINARLKNKGLNYLKTLPTPSGTFLLTLDTRMSPEMAERYQSILLYYIAWEEDPTEAVVGQQKWTVLLSKALTGRSGGYDFTWLLDWINKTSGSEKLTIDSFWVSTGVLEGTPVIEPCFTVKGKQVIDSFIERIKQVSDRSSLIDSGITRFKADYAQHYMAAWEQFADDFPAAIYSFSSIHEMRSQAADIGNGKIPADIFIQRLVAELKPFADDKNAPDWLKLAIDYDKLLRNAQQEQMLKQASGVSKALSEMASKGKTLMDEAKSKESLLKEKPPQTSMMELLQGFGAFRKALQEMAKGVSSAPAATRLAGEIFGDTSPPPPQPEAPGGATAAPVKRFQATQDSMKSFEALMRPVGDDPIFWDIIHSSLDFFSLMASREASCSLQSQWQSQVLAETAAATEANINDLLFGAQGTVWKFVKGPAAPFLKPTVQGYQPVTSMGQRISFNQEFLDFLNRGNVGHQSIQDSYSVRVIARPVHVNRETTPKPHLVSISLSCGDTTQFINNMNFPVSKIFKWSPKSCGETILRIRMGGVTLEKIYSGSRGFINFLADFKHGHKEFTPEDFPEQQQQLQQMRLRQIRLNYSFSGHQQLLSLPEYAPLSAPPVITNCWKKESDEPR